MLRSPGPLWRRAPLRLLRTGAWAALVLAALTLLCAAAAAPQLFANASDDAAIRTAIEAVPAGTRAADAPIVSVNGGQTPTAPHQAALLAAVAAVPGLSVGVPTGGSVGVELAGAGNTFRPFVSAHGVQVRARLYGQDELARQLVPAPGSPAVAAAGGGVWLPQAVARQLGVAPGDPVTLGIVTGFATNKVRARLAGLYVVAADGRRPADPPGTDGWAQRSGLLPRDSEFVSSPAYLVLADVATAQRLADAVGDKLFWTVEAHLDPPVPTLAQAQQTADAVVALQRELLDPTKVDIQTGPLRPTLVSGLPQVVATAQSITGATLSRTRTLAWAGIALGLVATLGVAVLTAARRRYETSHSMSTGLRPLSLSLQAAVEAIPLAALALVLGNALSVGVVLRWGPRAPKGAVTMGTAAVAAAAAAVAGLLILALVAGVAAALAARRAAAPAASRPPRSVPWEAGLGVTALTAVLGLITRPGGSSVPGPLDLLVPLLVVSAVAAVGGRLLLDLVARFATRAALARGEVGGRPRSPALWLAGRRLAVAGHERILVVTLLGAGLGMLLYASSAGTSVRVTTEDRVAVLSGSTASAELQGSWLLDPHAPLAPKPVDPGYTIPVPRSELLPVFDPVVPGGASVVWRRSAIVPSQEGQVDLLIINPATFAQAASWGRGPELARARTLLPPLGRAGAVVARGVNAGQETLPVPAILVGDPSQVGIAATSTSPGLSNGESVAVEGDEWQLGVKILATTSAFPGHQGSSAMLVMPSDAFFAHLGGLDPRYKPRPGENPADTGFTTYVWSSGGIAGVEAALAPTRAVGVITTEAQARSNPAFVAATRSLGYVFALGVSVAALAIVGLGLFADRLAGRSRAADVMLARVGLRRRGTRRARLIELALLTATAMLAAVAGVALSARLGPLGMDPGATAAPAFHLRVGGGAYALLGGAALVALMVAVVVAAARTNVRSEGTAMRDAV